MAIEIPLINFKSDGWIVNKGKVRESDVLLCSASESESCGFLIGKGAKRCGCFGRSISTGFSSTQTRGCIQVLKGLSSHFEVEANMTAEVSLIGTLENDAAVNCSFIGHDGDSAVAPSRINALQAIAIGAAASLEEERAARNHKGTSSISRRAIIEEGSIDKECVSGVRRAGCSSRRSWGYDVRVQGISNVKCVLLRPIGHLD